MTRPEETGKRISGNGAPSSLQRVLAWGVHLFTASGAVWCLLAIDAGIKDHWREAFFWLALAMLVDSVDGFLARWVRVKEALPHFDGALLDNLIDYANYVIVPAFFLYRAELVAAPFSLGCAAAIVLASAYQFCQSDAKTPDHYFKGFPSYWNVTVLYLLAMRLSPTTNLAIVILLVVLVFVPIKYVYPSRTRHLRALTLVLASLWGIALIGVVWQFPHPSNWLIGVSLLFVAYYFGLSLFLTFRPPGEQRS